MPIKILYEEQAWLLKYSTQIHLYFLPKWGLYFFWQEFVRLVCFATSSGFPTIDYTRHNTTIPHIIRSRPQIGVGKLHRYLKNSNNLRVPLAFSNPSSERVSFHEVILLTILLYDRYRSYLYSVWSNRHLQIVLTAIHLPQYNAGYQSIIDIYSFRLGFLTI